MPTYVYRCPNCGHGYEKLQKITDRTSAKCPQCGTRGERQITGGAGLVFKGSGFYITDYKRKAESGGEGGDGAKRGKKTESETKPGSESPAEAAKPKKAPKSTGGET